MKNKPEYISHGILPDLLAGSQFNDNIILSDDANTLSNDDFITTGASNQINRNSSPN